MEIRINIVEVASELAHEAMIDETFRNGFISDENEAYISSNDDDEIMYTDFCQKIFDEYYDYYYDILLKLKR